MSGIEAVRAAKLAELKEAIEAGLDSGPAEPWDGVESVKREGRRRLAERQKKAGASKA
jgi:hypothetical protein